MPEFDKAGRSRTGSRLIVAELAGDEWTTKLKKAINECDEEGLQEPSFEDYPHQVAQGILRELRQATQSHRAQERRATRPHPHR
jgi:hypothetical protein